MKRRKRRRRGNEHTQEEEEEMRPFVINNNNISIHLLGLLFIFIFPSHLTSSSVAHRSPPLPLSLTHITSTCYLLNGEED